MIITPSPTSGSLAIPISLIFWAYVAVYAVHILEESVLGEVFVDKVRATFWPEYSWRKFFWFNTLLMSLNICAVLVYESLGGAWLVFPLSLALERCLNDFWHLGETIVTRTFSSGLLSSIPTWILTYLVVRYALLKGEISIAYFACSAVIGASVTALMMGSLLAFRRKFRTTLQSPAVRTKVASMA
jgi:Protein of unknown function with HXXEE motif